MCGCGGGSSVKLRFNYEGSSTFLQADEGEIIDCLFIRYLVKHDLDPYAKFYYGGKDVGRCGKRLFELGIVNFDTFNVVSYEFLFEACGVPGIIDFADAKSGKTKRLDFSGLAPKWRSVVEGLNIFGVCKNSKCEAYKKEVVHKVGILFAFEPPKIIKFDLKKEVLNIKCPMRDKIIKAKTCGFWKCEYQFSGITIEDGEQKEFDSNPKETKSDEFEYFDPYANGETKWVELIIYVLPKQKIKYLKS